MNTAAKLVLTILGLAVAILLIVLFIRADTGETIVDMPVAPVPSAP